MKTATLQSGVKFVYYDFNCDIWLWNIADKVCEEVECGKGRCVV